ncbi:MAG: hypothetical protein ACLR5S_11230 [Ruminococcus sp.]
MKIASQRLHLGRRLYHHCSSAAGKCQVVKSQWNSLQAVLIVGDVYDKNVLRQRQ